MCGFYVCIGKDCTAKSALGVTALAEKVFKAKEVEAVAAEWAQKDPNKTAEQIFLTTQWKDREGNVRERQISVSEARMEFYDLQNYLGECTSCPANISSERFKGGVFSGFGCYMVIGSPISKSLEDAIMAGANRAVTFAKSEPSISFLERIAKEKVTGNAIAALRNESPPGIESTAPQSITWGGMFGKKTVTSDMLLEMFLTGTATPDDCLLFHHFCENIHTALLEQNAPYDLRQYVTNLSTLYGTSAEMGRPITVYRD